MIGPLLEGHDSKQGQPLYQQLIDDKNCTVNHWQAASSWARMEPS